MILQKDTINFYLCRNRFPSLSQKLRSAWPSGRSGAISGVSPFEISFLIFFVIDPNRSQKNCDHFWEFRETLFSLKSSHKL